MQRRTFLTLLLTASLGAARPAVHAQRGDMQHFAEFDGLDRVIARSWMAPMTSDAAASPVASPSASPSASPVADSGIRSLSVFVYLFENDGDALSGYVRIDDALRETRDSDPKSPMGEELPLDGVGDEANGYMGEMSQGGEPLTFTFATVLDGPFVYSLSGVFTGNHGAEQSRAFAEAMVGAPMDRMAEQFDPNGGSRGGLWRKLNAVTPAMPEGSTVTDFEVYPLPESAVAQPLHSLTR